VRFLRMLSNSAIGGVLAASYLIVLVLHLNPSFPLTFRALAPLALALLLAYGVNIIVAFYALIVLRQLLAVEVLSPGWFSVRLSSWLCTFAACGGALIMWLNVRSFGPVLEEQTISQMKVAASMISASAVVFLLIAIAHISRRGGAATALLLVVTMVLSVVAPVSARGWGAEPSLSARPTTSLSAVQSSQPGGRIFLLMFEGASLDVISPAVAEGRLPNFGRLFDSGAVLHLATLRPTQPETVWSAAATGRRPAVNGVRAAAMYRVRPNDPPLSLLPDYCFAQALVRFRFLVETAHDSRSLQAAPLWSILSGVRVRVAIIGWPLTHPAPVVNGLVVSDTFHSMTDAELDVNDNAAVSPRGLLPDVRRSLAAPANPDPVALVSRIARAPGGDVDTRRDPAPIIADRVHLQVFHALEDAFHARFTAVRFPGLDAVGHYFLRYANPVPFGDVSEEERRRFGRVLNEYYGFVDTIVGNAIALIGPDDLLLVVSGFGMEPLGPGKRLLELVAGNPEVSGSHEQAPDGFLMAYGTAVQAGRPQRASVLDLTPTILYYLGLPVGRDMDGFARTDIFRGSFTSSRPITFIPTYDR
jgi:Type I phosphodiesterase / nucleotide pyrophosphatase